MPPVPAVSEILPPLPFKAVAAPALSSKMIWPDPIADCTTTSDAPAVVTGVAMANVMLPVWALSPMVSISPAVVLI